jgi:hypothetical protein
MKRRLLLCFGLSLLLVALAATPALAATTDPTDLGKNVGQMFTSWATWIFMGVAALVSIPSLAKRDISGGVVLVGMCVLLGGFVFYQTGMGSLIQGLWQHAAQGG